MRKVAFEISDNSIQASSSYAGPSVYRLLRARSYISVAQKHMSFSCVMVRRTQPVFRVVSVAPIIRRPVQKYRSFPVHMHLENVEDLTYTVADPGFPVWGGGGANLRRVHFSAKTYVKTKEIDPVGGGAPAAPPLDPPMHYTGHFRSSFLVFVTP